MKKTILILFLTLWLSVSAVFLLRPVVQAEIPRSNITRMNGLSKNPAGYEFIDWKETTLTYIDFLFNTENTVQTKKDNQTVIQPVSWFATAPNVDTVFQETGNRVIAFPSYFGMNNPPNMDTSRGEGINVIAAVLSASLAGYDMTQYTPAGSTQQPRDFVKMMVNYYAIHNGERVVLNNSHSNTGGSWWYELLPSALFVSLASLYINRDDYDSSYLIDILYHIADQWLSVVVAAGGEQATFSNRKSYSIRNGTFTSGGWNEPDAAAGMAYILYTSYLFFRDQPDKTADAHRFLQGARWCMDFLQRIDYNPFYEVLVYYAALVAARMNLEFGTQYNVTRMINWTLDGSSAVRGGWGMIQENWGGFHTQGLMGSLTDGDGYAFQMNTFDAALGFLPLVKYQPGYAYSIGKWVLNVSHSAKYFFPDYLPNANQTSREWATTNGTGRFIGYEGLRKVNKRNPAASPAGWGDPLDYNWGPLTDFGYGNSHMGFFSGIRPTNVSRILQVDLNLLDFFGDRQHPSYLYYNPYESSQQVIMNVPSHMNLYELTTETFVAKTFIDENTVSFSIPADTAYVIVVIPSESDVSISNGILKADQHFVGKTTHGFSNQSIAVIPSNLEWHYQVQYPLFLSPDSISVHWGSEIIGEGLFQANSGSLSLAIEVVGSGIVPLTIRTTRQGKTVEEKIMNWVLFDPEFHPKLQVLDSASLFHMFTTEYQRWNNGLNPDRQQADGYRAQATLLDDQVMLTLVSDTWGVAGSSKVSLNLENTTILQFYVHTVSHRWTAKIYFPGGDRWGYYLSGETSSTGWITIDVIQEAVRRNPLFPTSGMKDCYIWFIPAGGNQATLALSSVSIWNLNDLLSIELLGEHPQEPEDPTPPDEEETPSDPGENDPLPDEEPPVETELPPDLEDTPDPDVPSLWEKLGPWISGISALLGLLILLLVKRKTQG